MCDIGIIGTKHFFSDRQRALTELLGIGIATYLPVKRQERRYLSWNPSSLRCSAQSVGSLSASRISRFALSSGAGAGVD